MFGFLKIFGSKKAEEAKSLSELVEQVERRQSMDISNIWSEHKNVQDQVVIQKVQEPVCLAAALKLDQQKDMVKERLKRSFTEQRALDMAARVRREESERQSRIDILHHTELQRQARELAELRYREEERMIRRGESSVFIDTSPAIELVGELAALIAFEEVVTSEPVYVEPEPVYVEPEPVYDSSPSYDSSDSSSIDSSSSDSSSSYD